MSILDDNIIERADDALAQESFDLLQSFFYKHVYSAEYNVAYKECSKISVKDINNTVYQNYGRCCDLKLYKYNCNIYSFYDIVRNGPRYDVILRDDRYPVLVIMTDETFRIGYYGEALRFGKIFPKYTEVHILDPINLKITKKVII